MYIYYQEAETLILGGRTANNKSFFDAQMIINLKDTYFFIMHNKDLEVNIQNIKNIHKLAMKNLLSDNELGNVRKIPVRIGRRDYVPSTDKNLLEDSLNKIVLNSNKYIDNFEKAIYLHNNLAYLKYFINGNKITARIIQAVILVDNNISEYKKSLLSYYAEVDCNEYKDFY